MAYDLIKVEETHDGAVTEITLGPGPANILSAQVMQEISTQLKEEEKNPHKKLIVFTSEGKHFSFGASVEEHKPGQVNDMLPAFHRFIDDLITCSIPTMAKVSGLCLGGAFEMVLACTFMYADETAKFGVPEIQLGVLPPVACLLLPLKCGEAISSEIILSGGQFSANKLLGHGLINKVVEKGTLDETVSGIFEKEFLPKSASSIRIAHKACRMVVAEQYKHLIGRLESLYLEDLMDTADAVEGINSFLEKRTPEWKDE